MDYRFVSILPPIIAIAVGSLALIWFYRRIGLRRGRHMLGAIAIYLVAATIPVFLYRIQRMFDFPKYGFWNRDEVQALGGIVFKGISEIALFFAAIVLIRLWWPEFITTKALSTDKERLVDRDVLRKRIDGILNRDFFTALNESLPKGAHDAEHGLDYIPYLLQAVRTRRDRFTRSARLFLLLTIGMGLVSALTVAGFGWIILQDESAGAPRAIRDVQQAVTNLSAALRRINLGYKQSEEFLILERAVRSDAGIRNAVVRLDMVEAIDNAENSLIGLDNLVIKFNLFMPRIVEVDNRGRIYKAGIRLALGKLNKWESDQRDFISGLTVSQEQLQKAIPMLVTGISQDEFRVAEIVRRLAIGIVVVTFFLALVRFFGQLYRSDYAQVLRADLDDITIRSFYVSYKAANDDAAQRAKVLATFLAGISAGRAESDKAGDKEKSMVKEELEVIKELISAAAKKI